MRRKVALSSLSLRKRLVWLVHGVDRIANEDFETDTDKSLCGLARVHVGSRCAKMGSPLWS